MKEVMDALFLDPNIEMPLGSSRQDRLSLRRKKIPNLMKDIDIEIQVATKAEGLDADGYLFVVPVEKDSEKDAEKDESITPVSFSKMFPAWVKEDVLKFASQRKFEVKPNTLLSFDDKEGRRVSIGLFAKHEGVFEWLTHARKVVQPACIEPKVRHLAVDLTSCKALTSRGVMRLCQPSVQRCMSSPNTRRRQPRRRQLRSPH